MNAANFNAAAGGASASVANLAAGEALYLVPDAMPCPWDLQGDGSVGVSDFLDLLGHWGPCP